MSRSSLVDFYSGTGRDFAGRSIDDIWRMSLDELEYTHDYIQWLFPLRERSGVQPDAPVLDDAIIAAFAAANLHERIERSARVMARFYGFEISEDVGAFTLRWSGDFDERRRTWLTRGNHNFLRLTRIMKSLATLGHGALAVAWLAALESIFTENSDVIGRTTLDYWRGAVGQSSRSTLRQ